MFPLNISLGNGHRGFPPLDPALPNVPNDLRVTWKLFFYLSHS
jgi:hypothetical protein